MRYQFSEGFYHFNDKVKNIYYKKTNQITVFPRIINPFNIQCLYNRNTERSKLKLIQNVQPGDEFPTFKVSGNRVDMKLLRGTQ